MRRGSLDLCDEASHWRRRVKPRQQMEVILGTANGAGHAINSRLLAVTTLKRSASRSAEINGRRRKVPHTRWTYRSTRVLSPIHRPPDHHAPDPPQEACCPS